MSQPFRTATNGRIDRSREIRFTFDRQTFVGHPGDTIASALLANGVHLMGRSFKYHRPRGVLGFGSEEPNALVGVDRGKGRFEPNQRATMVRLTEGLVVESQNRSPSLRRDAGAINDLLSKFIPAGFYYKTFKWPRSFWAKVYEPVIRRAAGLGRAPRLADPDRYGHRWAHCDTLVVGGGPAGLSAALAAAGRCERVILCDEGEELGGSLLDEPGADIDGEAALRWIEETTFHLAKLPGITLLRRTTAFGSGIGNFVALAQRCDDSGKQTRERQWFVRAGRIVFATGSIERPIVFANNDRPGIMLAGAARSFLHRHGVLVGRNVVIVAEHDSGYRAALDLRVAGVAVTVVDARVTVAADLVEQARDAGITLLTGSVPVDSRGRLRVSALALAPVGDGNARQWLECDAVLMAGGWTPSIHLHSQSGGKVEWSAPIGAFLPGAARQATVAVGACAGQLDLNHCLLTGWQGGGGDMSGAPHSSGRCDVGTSHATASDAQAGAGKAFVDFQNDVTAKDIRLAVREGFQSVEHIKRYTTNGMATDQGRTSNINALAIAAQALGKTIPEAGLTTFRAPFSPTTFGTMAGFTRGALFEPVRTPPLHDRLIGEGAVFEHAGQWKRPRYYAQLGETMDKAVLRECATVRRAAGMFDASTLGKIEVVGPDAAAFLDFIYAGKPSSLGEGRCRYALMLREDGFILDDGIITRLEADRFHVTTTSAGAATVLATMEDFRQTELPEMCVWLTSTTEQWAVIAINGPKARDVLIAVTDDVSLTNEDFPHMSMRTGTIAAVPARIFRVSFTGELGYEINVPARRAALVWDRIRQAGKQFGLGVYGLEASQVLRAEKGYIIVGRETDGTTTPDDVGLGGMVAKSKPDFVGKRSLMRDAAADPMRKQLVALLPCDGQPIEEGSQVIDSADPGHSIGHVSSAYCSAELGGPFALAMIQGGRSRHGTRLAIATAATPRLVDLRDPVLVDPAGARLHG
jgi:sarcosine oxidase subunit alpha